MMLSNHSCQCEHEGHVEWGANLHLRASCIFPQGWGRLRCQACPSWKGSPSALATLQFGASSNFKLFEGGEGINPLWYLLQLVTSGEAKWFKCREISELLGSNLWPHYRKFQSLQSTILEDLCFFLATATYQYYLYTWSSSILSVLSCT